MPAFIALGGRRRPPSPAADRFVSSEEATLAVAGFKADQAAWLRCSRRRTCATSSLSAICRSATSQGSFTRSVSRVHPPQPLNFLSFFIAACLPEPLLPLCHAGYRSSSYTHGQIAGSKQYLIQVCYTFIYDELGVPVSQSEVNTDGSGSRDNSVNRKVLGSGSPTSHDFMRPLFDAWLEAMKAAEYLATTSWERRGAPARAWQPPAPAGSCFLFAGSRLERILTCPGCGFRRHARSSRTCPT